MSQSPLESWRIDREERMGDFCQQCGAAVGPAWDFCRSCGTALADLPADSEVEPSQPADVGVNAASVEPRRRPRRLIAAALVGVAALVAGGIMVFLGNGQEGDVGEPLSAPRPTSTASPTTASPSASSPATSATFADLYENRSDGIVRVDVLSCDASGLGTGFLIEERLVVTAAHVVDEAATIGITSQVGATTTGTVVGIDDTLDLALVRAAAPLSGFKFEFDAGTELRPGEPVAALGFPVGNPLTMTQGTISGLDRSLEREEGRELDGLVQTDAALNPGNSGGPLLNRNGGVVGVVILKDLNAEGTAYALPAALAEPHIRAWTRSPRPRPSATCERPLGPSGTTRLEPSQDVADGVAFTLANYFVGINTADYALAWSQLSPAAQARNPYGEFADEISTSYDFNFEFRDIRQPSGDLVVVYLAFTSIQAPGYGPDGEDCTHWTLDYEMRRFGDRWFIDRVTFHDGTPGHRPCG